MAEKIDRGPSYERPIRVDGNAMYEVGVRDPSGNGYHTVRIPFDEEDFDREELQKKVTETRQALKDAVTGARENRGFEEYSGVVEELAEGGL